MIQKIVSLVLGMLISKLVLFYYQKSTWIIPLECFISISYYEIPQPQKHIKQTNKKTAKKKKQGRGNAGTMWTAI